ncbi:MAG: hypothetical protein ABI674_02225 [Spartobacteria bacterium]
MPPLTNARDNAHILNSYAFVTFSGHSHLSLRLTTVVTCAPTLILFE